MDNHANDYDKKMLLKRYVCTHRLLYDNKMHQEWISNETMKSNPYN
jgi:hypothetical protein